MVPGTVKTRVRCQALLTRRAEDAVEQLPALVERLLAGEPLQLDVTVDLRRDPACLVGAVVVIDTFPADAVLVRIARLAEQSLAPRPRRVGKDTDREAPVLVLELAGVERVEIREPALPDPVDRQAVAGLALEPLADGLGRCHERSSIAQ